jgi:hypothetical protein
MHKDQLHNFYSVPTLSEISNQGESKTGNVLYIGDKSSACKVLVMNPEANMSLGRLLCRLEDYIKLNYEEIG